MTSRPATADRFEALDALRGIAAVAVALYHFGVKSPPPGFVASPSGFLAVDFFFCLSGFVIAHTYDQRFAHGLSVTAFLRKRIIRFYPFFLLGTCIGILAWLAQGHLHAAGAPSCASVGAAVLLSVVFLPTYSFDSAAGDVFYPFNIAAWSLFFELTANAVYAGLYRFMDRRMLAACIILSAFLLIFVACTDHTISAGFSFRGLPGIARSGFSFFLGALLRRYWTPALRSPVTFPVLAAAIVCIALLPPDGKFGLLEQLLIIFFVSPMIVFAGAALPRGLPYGGSLLQELGGASYGFYIIHMPAIALVFALMPHLVQGPCAPLILMFEASAVLGFLISITLVYERRIDVPFRRLLAGVFRRRLRA